MINVDKQEAKNVDVKHLKKCKYTRSEIVNQDCSCFSQTWKTAT